MTEHGYQIARLSRMQRLWRAAGFGPRLPPAGRPKATEWMAAGDLSTRTVIHLSWADRLRLVLSGRMEVNSRTYTDAPVAEAVTVSATGVLAPGSRR